MSSLPLNTLSQSTSLENAARATPVSVENPVGRGVFEEHLGGRQEAPGDASASLDHQVQRKTKRLEKQAESESLSPEARFDEREQAEADQPNDDKVGGPMEGSPDRLLKETIELSARGNDSAEVTESLQREGGGGAEPGNAGLVREVEDTTASGTVVDDLDRERYRDRLVTEANAYRSGVVRQATSFTAGIEEASHLTPHRDDQSGSKENLTAGAGSDVATQGRAEKNSEPRDGISGSMVSWSESNQSGVSGGGDTVRRPLVLNQELSVQSLLSGGNNSVEDKQEPTSEPGTMGQDLKNGPVASGKSFSRSAGAASDPATGFQQARFIQRVTKAFQIAEQRGEPIRLRLHPPELGSLRLEVKLEGNLMVARIEAETQSARMLLIDHLPLLRDRLAEQEIQIQQFDVDLLDQRSTNADERQEKEKPERSTEELGGNLESSDDNSLGENGLPKREVGRRDGQLDVRI